MNFIARGKSGNSHALQTLKSLHYNAIVISDRFNFLLAIYVDKAKGILSQH
jgi:hypothetical protein